MPYDDASMGHLVNRAARLFRQLADRRLAPLGLASGHLPVLTALMSAEALSQKELTKHAGIEQPTMAATLSRMERDKIIERRVDPNDRRSSLFSLAPSTRCKLESVKKVTASINETALAHLAIEDRAKFRTLLCEVIDAMEQAFEG